jgi:hypothetical protein
MIYTAERTEETSGTALTVERSAFSPTPALMRDWLGRRVSREQFEREYRQQLRGFYRSDPRVWVELVEQAAVEDVWLVGEPVVAQLLRECLIRVGVERGLPLDPDEDRLGRTLLESARMKVLAREGIPRVTELDLVAAVGVRAGKMRYR